ncbi:MAG TPA: Na+/H+ antiporter NhaA [Chitinophagaceae bacterium]|nr:Na+/H+ antiporter NhaA [Chitinophagaceae bacterium]
MPLRRLKKPIQLFTQDSRSVGILLLACTAISLVIANLPQGIGYVNFWNIEIEWLHALHLPHSPLHLVNDGLMALFFFLAGMEIRQEMQEGELSTLNKAALPVAAAVGGMIMPAILYILFNKGTAYSGGWAIPASTDIAFSLGVASLLGKRVPVTLKIFLTALAIIDDLGAIIIIALFYGEPVKAFYLLGAVAIILIVHLLNRQKVKFGILHILFGLLLWYAIFNSGIHATVAGVIFALLIPRHLLGHIRHQLHHPVNFIIIPVFALANTAIIFPENAGAALTSSLSWGIILGLVLGKPLGIFLASYLLVQKKKAELPEGVSWMQLTGAGFLAGIGFTMSIFIAMLAFSQPAVQDIAKVAVLVASLVAIICSIIWLRWTGEKGK